MTVEYGRLKIVLVCVIALAQGLAEHPALPFAGGQLLHDLAAIVWPAASAVFVYLLKPASKEQEMKARLESSSFEAGGKR